MNPISDTSRLAVHTITTKPWSLEEAVDRYAEAGAAGITVWTDALEGRSPEAAGRRIRESGLDIISLARGGFFPAPDAAGRRKAVDANLRLIDTASGLGAPAIVMVCGAVPGLPLREARDQILKGFEAVLPRAADAGVKLAVEPLHPMYADTRSAINTMKQANDLCGRFDSPWLGVTVDVYHVWWDPDLEDEIGRCGKAGRIFAYHISDWRSPTRDILNDRALMGEGCIPLRTLRSWVERAGFEGYIEVEIFSNEWWGKDQKMFLDRIVESFLQYA